MKGKPAPAAPTTLKELTNAAHRWRPSNFREETAVNRKLPAYGACAVALLGSAFSSQAATPIVCNSLQGRTIAGATITTAQLNAATATLPDHCEVLGKIDERQGLDGQTYAIKFHLRMPTAWNNRF